MEVTTKYIDYNSNTRRTGEQETTDLYNDVERWYYYKIHSEMIEFSGQGHCSIYVSGQPYYKCELTYYPEWKHLTDRQKNQLTNVWTRCQATTQKSISVYYFAP